MKDVLEVLNELPVWVLNEVFGHSAGLEVNDGKIVAVSEN